MIMFITKATCINSNTKRRWYLVALLLMCWFIFGFLQFKPLTRQDAYRLNDNFKSYLALNPFQNFITTLKYRKPDFNTSGAAKYYETMADYLQLDSATKAAYYLPTYDHAQW
jgi:hypothetical protein